MTSDVKKDAQAQGTPRVALETADPKRLDSPDELDAFDKVRRATIDVLPRLDPARVVPGASVMETGIDSLKVIELTLALEERFGEPVSLPEWLGSVEDASELTFGSLARYLCRTLNQP